MLYTFCFLDFCGQRRPPLRFWVSGLPWKPAPTSFPVQLSYWPTVLLSLLYALSFSHFRLKKKEVTSFFFIYANTFVTTPDPTVLPPSLMENLRPSSMAIGVISSIINLELSPGITISIPSSSWMSPVTSVVLK